MVKGLLFAPLFALVALTLTRAEEQKVVCVYNSKAYLREGNKYLTFKIFLKLREQNYIKYAHCKSDFKKLKIRFLYAESSYDLMLLNSIKNVLFF